jgi:WD40 repeat protein
MAPNGRVVAAQKSQMGAVHVDLLDTETGNRVGSWDLGQSSPAHLQFTPDGKTLIAAGDFRFEPPPRTERCVRFFSLIAGRETHRIDFGSDQIYKLAVSPDGMLVAVIYHAYAAAGGERQIGVCELSSGRRRFHIVQPTAGPYGQRYFSALTFAPDSQSLLTIGGEENILVWDMTSGKLRERIGKDVTNSNDLAIAPDGKNIAVGHHSRIQLINRDNGKEILLPVGHQLNVVQVVFAPSGKTVITGNAESIIWWDARTGREIRRLDEGKHFGYYQLADDGRTAHTSVRGGEKVTAWDLETGKELLESWLSKLGKKACVFWTDPGNRGFGSAMASLLDLGSGGRPQGLMSNTNGFTRLRYSVNGQILAAFEQNHVVEVWNIKRGARVCRIGPMGELGPALCENSYVAAYASELSPDGNWIAYGGQPSSYDNENFGYLSVYDALSGQEVYRIDQLADGAGVFAFSPDSHTLAWAGWREPAIHLLELSTGSELRVLVGHTGRVQSLSFSPDGKSLVSGSNDTTALVWDLSGKTAAADAFEKEE